MKQDSSFLTLAFHKMNLQVYYIVSQMDKKPVIKTLRKDFELVLMRHLNADRLIR